MILRLFLLVQQGAASPLAGPDAAQAATVVDPTSQFFRFLLSTVPQ